VYYLDPDEKFPSTKYKPARWLGVAHNMGDAMTFRLLSEDTERVIERSAVARAEDVTDKTMHWDPDLDRQAHDEPHDLSSNRQRVNPSSVLRRKTRLASKKQLRRAHRRGNATFVPSPRGEENNTNGEPDNPDTGETNPDTGEAPNQGTGETMVIGETNLDIGENLDPDTATGDGTDVAVDCRDDSPSVSSSDESYTCTKTKTIRKQANVPRPALASTPIAMRRSVRNRKPRERMNLATIRTALQTAIIATAATLFPPTTQFVNFPVVFETPLSCEGLVQSSLRAQINRPNLSIDAMNKGERQQLRYVQQMDELIEGLVADPDDAAWDITKVISHCVYKRHGKRQLLVKIQWTNDGHTWERNEAIRLQQPEVLVAYALHHSLGHHKDWQWTKEYAKQSEHKAKLVMALRVAVERGKKYKFGIEVPRSVAHALYLDRVNGNHLWQEAIENELRQINEYKTFRKLIHGESIDDYTKIPYHMVFDVKFDLRQKARLVAGGNHTDPSKEDIFSGIVGMETVRLGFLIAAMNGLDVCAADIGNAFLYGRTHEKVYIIAGKEFGGDTAHH